MQFVTKYTPPKSLINPMTFEKNARKKFKFGQPVCDLADLSAIKKAKIQENMISGREVENYQPLFKQIHRDNPIDRNRYR